MEIQAVDVSMQLAVEAGYWLISGLVPLIMIAAGVPFGAAVLIWLGDYV